MKLQTAKKIVKILNLKDYQKRYILKQLQKYKDEISDDMFFTIIEDGSILEEYDAVVIWKWIDPALVNVKKVKLYKLLSNWKRYDEDFQEVNFEKNQRQIAEEDKEKKLLVVFYIRY